MELLYTYNMPGPFLSREVRRPEDAHAALRRRRVAPARRTNRSGVPAPRADGNTLAPRAPIRLVAVLAVAAEGEEGKLGVPVERVGGGVALDAVDLLAMRAC